MKDRTLFRRHDVAIDQGGEAIHLVAVERKRRGCDAHRTDDGM